MHPLPRAVFFPMPRNGADSASDGRSVQASPLYCRAAGLSFTGFCGASGGFC